jgi:hypothetical protein
MRFSYYTRLPLGVLCLAVGLVNLSAWAAEPELIAPESIPSATARKPLKVTYAVRWTGAPDAYVVLAPEYDSIAWGGIELARVETYVEDGMNVVAQTLVVTPVVSGEHAMPEVRIRFTPPEEVPQPESTLDQTPPTPSVAQASVIPTLRAAVLPIRVHPDRTPVYGSSLLGLLLFALFSAAWYTFRRRRQRSAGETATTGPPVEAIASALQSASTHRIDGDYYAFYRDLCRAAELMPDAASDLTHTLKARAEEAGYKGTRPTDEAMEGDTRAVQRALARLKEETYS